MEADAGNVIGSRVTRRQHGSPRAHKLPEKALQVLISLLELLALLAIHSFPGSGINGALESIHRNVMQIRILHELGVFGDPGLSALGSPARCINQVRFN